MNSRNEIPFSIENLLITDDALFEMLTEEEKDNFAYYCIKTDPHEFERCIQVLLKDYKWILTKAKLLETEHKMIEKSTYLEEHVEIFNKRLEEILNSLKQDILKSHSTLLALTNKDRMHDLKMDAELNASLARKELSSIKMAITKNQLFIEQFITDKTNLYKPVIEDAQKSQDALTEQLKTAQEKVQQSTLEAEIAEQNFQDADKTVTEGKSTVSIGKTSAQDTSSIYYFPIFTMQIMQENMLSQVQQLSQQSTALTRQSSCMREISQNLGMIKIQKRFDFCMNMVLLVPYQTLVKDQDCSPYYSITKAFGEFWYLHGVLLLPDDEHITEADRLHIKNLRALVFYFMSQPIEDIPAVKCCLIEILRYINDKKKITLPDLQLSPDKFAEQFPVEFIKLYQYLFETDNQFSKLINQLIEQKHMFVLYNMSLFHLYNHIAHKQINNPENQEKFGNLAKRGLFRSFKSGFEDAELWLVKYFYKEIPVKVELATFYCKYEQPGQDELSIILYQYFKKNCFEPGSGILRLFGYWMLSSNTVIRLYATNQIELQARQQNPLAWAILIRNANHNSDYAIIITKIALDGDRDMKHQALQVLSYHPNQDDRDIAFNKFLITKDLLHENNFPALVTAAKQGHEEASRLLIDYYENHKELRQEVQEQITLSIEKKPLYLLDLLKSYYLKKSPIVSLYDIENLGFFKTFFTYISISLTDKEEYEILKNLNSYAYRKYLNAYDALLIYTKITIKAAFVLAENLLAENNTEDMINEYTIKLIKAFNQHHTGNISFQKDYYLYALNKHAYGKANPDYLLSSCEEAFLPAIGELDLVLNTVPCDLDVLRIEAFKIILHNIAVTKSESTFTAAETLCIRYISENDYSKACHYFEICTHSKSALHQLCSRLEKQKCMNLFLRACDKKTYESIPAEFKKSEFGEVSVKSRIAFFQTSSQFASTQERPRPSEASMVRNS